MSTVKNGDNLNFYTVFLISIHKMEMQIKYIQYCHEYAIISIHEWIAVFTFQI